MLKPLVSVSPPVTSLTLRHKSCSSQLAVVGGWLCLAALAMLLTAAVSENCAIGLRITL